MIDKGKPLYIFNSGSSLKPRIKVSFSDTQVIVDTFYDYGKPTRYNKNISKLKLLPAIGYNQNSLEALLDNKYNEDEDEYDCNYSYDADDDEDTADDIDNDNNTDDSDDDNNTDDSDDDDEEEDDDSDDNDEEDDEW